MKLLPFLTAICLIFLSACQTTPDTVLEEKEMAYLLSDLELANALSLNQSTGLFYNDSLRLALRSSTLAKHGINEATLDTCFKWYGAHLPQYMKVIDLADSILSDSLRAFIAKQDELMRIAAGDSLNVWPHAPSAVFAQTQASDFVTFEIEADHTWKRGDLYTLEFAIDNSQSPIYVTMVVDYANRSRTSDAVTSKLDAKTNRRISLKLQLDSNISAKKVYGYLQLTPQKGERAFIDSIKLMRTRLVGMEYNKHRRITHRITRNDY